MIKCMCTGITYTNSFKRCKINTTIAVLTGINAEVISTTYDKEVAYKSMGAITQDGTMTFVQHVILLSKLYTCLHSISSLL